MAATIAVTGATGQLGKLTVAALKARHAAVVAVARTPEKGKDLGVEVRAGDYTQPDALVKAFAGIHTVVLISANEFGKRAEQHANVISAAKAAGVAHIVYTSVINADKWPADQLLAAEHFATEATLKASGLAWTILRNGWYYENNTKAILYAAASGNYTSAAGDGKFAFATRADYAEAAAAVAVAAAQHAGKIYELGGDTPVTLAEVAAEISKQTGKTVTYTSVPKATYAQILASSGLPQVYADTFAGIDALVPTGILTTDSKALSTLIGHPTTPLAAAITAALASGNSAPSH